MNSIVDITTDLDYIIQYILCHDFEKQSSSCSCGKCSDIVKFITKHNGKFTFDINNQVELCFLGISGRMYDLGIIPRINIVGYSYSEERFVEINNISSDHFTMNGKAEIVNFNNCKLTSSNFNKSTIWSSNFNDCDLSNSSFLDVDISCTSFKNCNLTNVKLVCYQQAVVDFENCDLTGSEIKFVEGSSILVNKSKVFTSLNHPIPSI